jgi:nicotinate phosphoribosyltransferase
VALRREDGSAWEPAIKVSDTPAKVVNPGRKQVARVYGQRGKAVADVLALADEELGAPLHVNHHSDPILERTITRISEVEQLLVPFSTEPVDQHEAILAARARRDADLERLDPGVRRLVNPHVYHVSLSDAVAEMKTTLIHEARTGNG